MLSTKSENKVRRGAPSIREFRSLVWKFYKKHGRHELPWRTTHDPYKIMVSEIMLQQTQVERVVPYYKNFLLKFPTVRMLAKAPLSDVLIAWQGLGYNRRAKMLHAAAKEVVEKYKGIFPKSVEELESLPGIGPYTARAIMAFAYNKPVVFIETNLRTVITNHFFANEKKVADADIIEILTKAFPRQTSEKGSREWHAALMDYGSYLKRSGVHINSKSKTYNKQSKFSGSAREARGAILKALAKAPQTKSRLLALLGDDRTTQLETQLAKLITEGLVQKSKSRFMLAE